MLPLPRLRVPSNEKQRHGKSQEKPAKDEAGQLATEAVVGGAAEAAPAEDNCEGAAAGEASEGAAVHAILAVVTR